MSSMLDSLLTPQTLQECLTNDKREAANDGGWLVLDHQQEYRLAQAIGAILEAQDQQRAYCPIWVDAHVYLH